MAEGEKGKGKTEDPERSEPLAEGDAPPTPTELEQRRAARASAESDAELEAKEGGKAKNGQSVAERAAAAAGDSSGDDAGFGEEDDGQMFVWEQGRKVTLGTLIARGIPVEHAFVFGGKRLKGRGQLMGFDEDSLIVGRGLVSKTSAVPTRDDDEKVTKVTIETHLAMKVILPADSDEAMGLLGGVLDRRGYRQTDAA